MTLAITKIAEVGPRTRSRSSPDRAVSSKFRIIVNQSKPDPVALETLLLADERFPSQWPSDTACVLSDFSINQMPNARRVWEVPATWATQQPGSSSDDPYAENPLLRPVQRSLSSVASTEFHFRDLDEKLYANTIGDPYDPKEVPVIYPEIRRKWTSNTFNEASADFFARVMNQSTWNGFAANTLRISDISAEQIVLQPNSVYPSGLTYWEIAVALSYNKDTWTTFVANSGFFTQVTVLGTVYRFRNMVRIKDYDDEDNPTIEFVPNEQRSLITEDGSRELHADEDPHIQEFRFFYPIPFTWIPV